ncbi:MAG: T9SS type A sorting domain-containing protein [Fidelibacterota bacterium]
MKKLIIILSSVALVSFAFSQTYVGSQACMGCHGVADLSGAGYDIYDSWNNSGHPYKFNETPGDTGPVYPAFVVNFEDGWMSGLGADWMDVSGVIGGFGWKARFVDNEGTIAGTGSSLINPGVGHNQFNFFGGEDHGWADYHASDVNKVYNYSCFRCHTTGPSPDGSWIPGQDLGSFAESGIGCEACHGPGSVHIGTMNPDDIDLVYERDINDGNGLGGQLPDPNGDDVNFMCGTCHNRNFDAQIDASGGFIRHHEQWDEFSATEHSELGFTCVTCHNPHKRVLWDGDGIEMMCETCHPTNVANNNHPAQLECTDCHMAQAAKSGTTLGESGYRGDVRSHLWKITPTAESMFTDDGAYVRDDETRQASLDIQHACLGCHNNDPNDDIPNKTAEELVGFAGMMHTPTDNNNYVGPETCLSCHTEKASWRNTLHANGFTVPKGENSMQDLYGIIADVDGNGVDDFMDGLDLSTVDAFAVYGANAPVLGYNADTDVYTITIGEVIYPVMLTYGGSGLYKQRYVLKVPLADGTQSAGHYVSPVQFNEKTDEYVTYHADAWYDESNMPIYGAGTTASDIAGSSRSFEKGCVGCHFTYTDVSQTTDGEWVADAPDASDADLGNTTYDIDGDGVSDLINTSCERCHGSGGGHFGDPAGIVNPEDLTAQQANDLCGFCHSRGKSFPNETFSFPYNDELGEDWDVGDAWGDYYINHGGFWGDGQLEGEKQTSVKHHQQYYDFYESSKPTFVYHEVRCFECHDVHNDVKHNIRSEIDEDGLLIATDNDNNTLCLACHSTHGYFEDITKEMVADYENNIDQIGAVVSQHTHHPYDPENGPSRCSKCHNPKVAKSAVPYDIHSHTFEPIPPYKTLDYNMPNACAASCHRGFENGDSPIFNTGADLSLTDWSEPEDQALAMMLMQYYGPGGEWWNTAECLAGDLDATGTIDVLDVVRLVGIILGNVEPLENDNCAGDVNGDGSLDILDVVLIVDMILNAPMRSNEENVNSASIMINDNKVSLNADGTVAGIQLEMEGDFEITDANLNPGWEIYYSESRIIMFSITGEKLTNETLFKYDGDLTFESGIVADWNFRGTPIVFQGVPEQFSLAPAYPNPFNPTTTITFGLPHDSNVKIDIYDMLGRQVDQLMNKNMTAGSHKITWNAENMASGLYMIKMESGDFQKIQKVLLMK